jgi:hypothetical protein
MTHTWLLPDRLARKPSQRPSGEKAGAIADMSPRVNRVTR